MAVVPSTGAVIGKPTRSGTFRPTFIVADAAGRTAVAATDIKVYAAAPTGPVMDAGKGTRVGTFADNPNGRGVAVVGDYAYTAQDNRILKVNLSSGGDPLSFKIV